MGLVQKYMNESENDPAMIAARIIFGGELEVKVEATLRRHSGVVCWTAGQSIPNEGMVDNGTFCFVQTSHLRFLLTCSHVWEGYQREKAKAPDTKLWIALNANGASNSLGRFITLEELRLIDQDKSRDLATVTFKGIESLEAWRFYHLPDHCDQRVTNGSPACFVGYSGERLRDGRRRGVLSYSLFTLYVSDTAQTKFLLHAKDGSRPLFDKVGNEIDRIKFGGVSGAPVFTLDQKGGLSLAGVVCEVSSSGRQSSPIPYELSDGDIYATYADFVHTDGSIQSV